MRFYLLSGHYRSPLEFSDKTLRQSEAGVSRVYEFVQKLNLTGGNGIDNAEKQIEKGRQTFLEAMDDNFNFPKALAAIFDLIRDTNNALVNNSLN